MSKNKNPSCTFAFEVFNVKSDSFCIREIGGSYYARFAGSLADKRCDIDLLGYVWFVMPKSERKLYNNSIVLFLDSAFSCPAALEDLRKSVGEVQFALWDLFPVDVDETLH